MKILDLQFKKEKLQGMTVLHNGEEVRLVLEDKLIEACMRLDEKFKYSLEGINWRYGRESDEKFIEGILSRTKEIQDDSSSNK